MLHDRQPVVAWVCALALLAAAPVFAAGDDTTAGEQAGWELNEDVRQSWQDFKTFTYEQQDEAVAAGETVIEAIDARLETLQDRAAGAGEAAAEAWEEREARLRELRSALSDDVAALREATADTYEATKEQVSESYAATRDALEEAWDALST